MRIDDETLMAYADGDLTPLEAKRIEAAMAEDPALAARVARFRSVRRALRSAYDSVAAEPIPEHLRALLGDVALHEPRDEPRTAHAPTIEATAREPKTPPRFGAAFWGVLAVGVVVGAVAARAFLMPPALITSDLHATGSLAAALDTQLTSAPQTGSIRIGATFRTHAGEVCRTFVRVGASSGFACRQGGRWLVRIATPGTSTTPAPVVRTMVDQIIEGQPFSGDQERAARDRAWQS